MAAVDRNGDGIEDIVCAPGPGGGPELRTVNALDSGAIDDFFADDPLFSAGLFVGGGA